MSKQKNKKVHKAAKRPKAKARPVRAKRVPVKRIIRIAATGVKAKAAAVKQLSAEQLITKGKERGYITYNEILKSFPHVEDDVDFLEALYERFSIAGIDVLEGGMLEDNADEYLATKNIKDRQS